MLWETTSGVICVFSARGSTVASGSRASLQSFMLNFTHVHVEVNSDSEVMPRSTGKLVSLGDDPRFCFRAAQLLVPQRIHGSSHLESGHHFLARYLASFGVEVSPAEYAVWTFWCVASGRGFRILWFDSGYSSYVSSRRLMDIICTFSTWRWTLDPVAHSRRLHGARES